MRHQVKMKLLAETKGALRYVELDPDGSPRTTSEAECIIGTLYLRKLMMGTDKPDEITVTVEA